MIHIKTLPLRAGTWFLLILGAASAVPAVTLTVFQDGPASPSSPGEPSGSETPRLRQRTRGNPSHDQTPLVGCQSGLPDVCDDGIACTEDTCDPVKGCLHAALNDRCDDENICTTDTCDPAAGCAYDLNGGAPCTDSNACTDQDACPSVGSPANGDQMVPPVSTSATGQVSVSTGPSRSRLTYVLAVEGIDPSEITGVDLHLGLFGTNGPTLFEIASSSFTSPHSGVLTAEDLIPQPRYGIVTFDDAVARILAGFSYVEIHTHLHPEGEIRGQIPFGFVDAVPGSSACTGAPIDCDDADACSVDSCNPQTGCAHTSTCDDGNPCTDDSCDPTAGCQHAFNTQACDDLNACTSDDVCSAGVCQGQPINPKTACSDGNSCTLDLCDPEFGCFNLRRSCNDFNRATFDSCVEGVGCVHTPR